MLMHLVQLLLPTMDNVGKPYDDAIFADLQKEFVERFGGVTAHSRAPAKGIWEHDGDNETDDIIIVEVMAEKFNRPWWQALRAKLEERMRQKQIIIRTHTIEII
jgi:hypothetical protein